MASGYKSPKTVANGLRAKAWWVIRKNRATTLKDLLLTLNDGSQKAASHNLCTYLKLLTDVGILTATRLPRGCGAYRYALAQDLGPKSPVARWSTQEVFDPNSGKVFRRQGGPHD